MTRGRAAPLRQTKTGKAKMRDFVSAACGLFFAVVPAAQAEDVLVVELFTSQGCVSCPPADDYFATLADDRRLIPLAWHVDYWDYIGWADSFANPRFTERQKRYAKAVGSRMIYTPQFIIAGDTRIQGLAPDQAAAAMEAAMAEPPQVRLDVRRDGDMLHIRAEPLAVISAPVLVQLVRYLPEATVEIERGENAGKTIRYRNVVTGWDEIARWDGAAPLTLDTPISGDAPAVVILQKEGPSLVLAAALPD